MENVIFGPGTYSEAGLGSEISNPNPVRLSTYRFEHSKAVYGDLWQSVADKGRHNHIVLSAVLLPSQMVYIDYYSKKDIDILDEFITNYKKIRTIFHSKENS